MWSLEDREANGSGVQLQAAAAGRSRARGRRPAWSSGQRPHTRPEDAGTWQSLAMTAAESGLLQV